MNIILDWWRIILLSWFLIIFNIWNILSVKIGNVIYGIVKGRLSIEIVDGFMDDNM